MWINTQFRKRPFLIDMFFERMDGYGWIKREIDVFLD
jgi:hypothetical protein